MVTVRGNKITERHIYLVVHVCKNDSKVARKTSQQWQMYRILMQLDAEDVMHVKDLTRASSVRDLVHHGIWYTPWLSLATACRPTAFAAHLRASCLLERRANGLPWRL